MSKRNPGGLISTTGLRQPSATDQSQNSGVWDLEEQYQARANSTWANPSGQAYEIGNSLRFRGAANAYLNRTPAAASDRRTWTWSCWFKRGNIATGADQMLFSAGSNVRFALFYSNSTGRLEIHGNGSIERITTAVYRDPSSWYHIVCVFNTTDSNAQNRIRLYVNGIEVVSWATNTAITQNAQYDVNSTASHQIGRNVEMGDRYVDGYLTEVNLIDGQALTPDYFGYTDFNGVWQPKKYIGSYGTNGFYLPFNPTAYGDSITTTTLGFDKSGNGNNWTTNNISTTAGVTYDSMVDSPTNSSPTDDTGFGGQVAGNYAVLNPLVPVSGTLTNGNLRFSTGASYAYANGTVPVPLTGKWIFEATFNINPTTNNYNVIGLTTISFVKSGAFTSTGAYGIEDVSTYGQRFVQNGVAQGSVTIPAGTVIQCLIDRDAGTLTFTKNGSLQTQAGSTVTIPAVELLTVVGSYNNNVDVNFGQQPFAYAAPTGFKCLTTANLPQPTIPEGGEYFNTVIYTGNHTYPRNIGVGFQPDFVWVKDRTVGYNHRQFDSLRTTKPLYSNTTVAEDGFNDGPEMIVRGHSDGFTIIDNPNGTNTSGFGVNNSGSSHVAWCWRAGGAAVANTQGSIASTVSANTDSGFSIVTYTGNGSAGATVGHGLGIAPNLVIWKKRSDTSNWFVWSKAMDVANGSTGWLYLNATNARQTSGSVNEYPTYQIDPTSTLLTLNGTGSSNGTNDNSATYVAYCFAEVEGYSKFGSYVGNGSADGTFVYTGFKPAWLMLKRSSQTESWILVDARRSPTNSVLTYLLADSSGSETTANIAYDFLSNGFKFRNNSQNESGATYIYMAFAEHPFKTARAR